jgi:ABC-2 type transport system ATP-binding protein
MRGEVDMELVIELRNVTKRFGGQVAVSDLSLQIPRGCIYGFLGPNGAGKTTTLRLVLNILVPDEGQVAVLGSPDTAAVRNRIGYLPEEKGLYKRMKVLESVIYFGQLKGLSRKVAAERARALLERYGLGEHLQKRCDALSKGMGQKVQLLATMIHEPELLVLDEPFSGLDPVNAEVLRDLIIEQKRLGRTVIYSTHVMEQAEQICDFIFLIDKGRKLLDGPLSEIKHSSELAVHLDYDGSLDCLRGLPGLARINDAGKSAEIFLAPGTDPQAVLSTVVGNGVKVRRFDLREPSLHEIFVRAVGGRSDA